MKKILFASFLCILVSCAKKEATVTKVKVSASDIKFITVQNPIDDIILWNSKSDTIYPNDTNEFVFEKKIEKPEVVTVVIGDQRVKSIYYQGKQLQ